MHREVAFELICHYQLFYLDRKNWTYLHNMNLRPTIHDIADALHLESHKFKSKDLQ